MKYEDGKYYHVYNRGAHKQKIFRNDDDFQRCLSLMEKYASRYHVSVMAYCLMPNHYHLLLRQNETGSISRFIQTVFNSYTQAINLSSEHSGTLLQGRAKGLLITTDEYAVRLTKYIHHNPVAAKLAVKPEEWKYSDYPEWIGLRKGSLSDLSLRDAYFQSGEEYMRAMEEYVLDKEIADAGET